MPGLSEDFQDHEDAIMTRMIVGEVRGEAKRRRASAQAFKRLSARPLDFVWGVEWRRELSGNTFAAIYTYITVNSKRTLQ